MKTSKLKEIEMIKAALYTDILKQKEWIETLRKQQVKKPEFEERLKETEQLYDRVCKKYFRLKAESEPSPVEVREVSQEELSEFLQGKELTLVGQTTSFKTHKEIVKWDVKGNGVTIIKTFDDVESVDHCYESMGGDPYLYIETKGVDFNIRMSKEGLKDFIDMLQEAYNNSKVRR
ncbi:hypothetical protein BSP9_147 [Bacillus phage BSP9]|nr:hypothetical protein BSP9_147 [Bacillus phage BSP9]